MKTRQIVMSGMMLLMAAVTMTSCVGVWKENTLFGDKYVTEWRGLKGFEEIEISGSPTVHYNQADSFSVKVKGTESQVENIITEMNGKTLVIRNKGKFGMFNLQLGEDDELAVYVTSPDLTSISLNGSGDFISRQRIDTDNMDVTLRGSGDIQVDDLICDRCHVELIGSGDIDLASVEAQETSAVLIGSGDIDLCLQKVDDTRLALKGSGDITVEFNKDCGAVDCDLRGSGDITLEGKVKKFSQYKSGSGDINVDKLYILK